MIRRLRTAVETACDRMGVVLTVSSQYPPMGASQWIGAPCGSAALYVAGDDRSVWLEDINATHEEAWIWVLHELEHVVFWHPDKGAECDERLMMPWAVAVLRAFGLRSSLYMRSDYTQATWVDCLGPNGRLREVSNWKRPERSAWFMRAKAANISAGTITANWLPTWRRPDWRLINLEDWA